MRRGTRPRTPSTMRTTSMASPRIGKVDESYGSLIGIEFGFQHHGVAAVPAPRRADWAGRCDQPPTVFLGAKQSSEDGPRVEPRYTQPVDRPIAANQRRRLRIADNRVVLNRQRQGDLLGLEQSPVCEVALCLRPAQNEQLWCTKPMHSMAVYSSRSIDYPPNCVGAHSCRRGRRLWWPCVALRRRLPHIGCLSRWVDHLWFEALDGGA